MRIDLLLTYPELALIPSLIFAVIYVIFRLKLTLLTSLAWFLYFAYEILNMLGITCSGECNIRIDLLLIYPVLAFLSLAGIISASRTFKRFLVSVTIAILISIVASIIYTRINGIPAGFYKGKLVVYRRCFRSPCPFNAQRHFAIVGINSKEDCEQIGGFPHVIDYTDTYASQLLNLINLGTIEERNAYIEKHKDRPLVEFLGCSPGQI